MADLSNLSTHIRTYAAANNVSATAALLALIAAARTAFPTLTTNGALAEYIATL